jgi:propionyl-CoA carboxylase alpha chain
MIRKLLIANRGEIAVRIMRSAHAAGIACVAVYSDPDAGAPHVRAADEAVRLPGAASSDTYLRTDLIVNAAIGSGADAVHPGYGFLSENAGFARACANAGLTFVGPPAGVIEAMGSKLAAKAMMAVAGVPVLPTIEVGHKDVGPSGDLDADAAISLVSRAEALGFPLLVKASAGGGGRGMRVVEDSASLVDAVEAAHRESLTAFGDATLFIEPYARRPRHIEVQVIGDSHGNVVHLFERECSIQRRHQKIVEESPSPALDDAMRATLTGAAVTAAKAIGYVNAGTVEFIMLEDRSFAFLEVNTRLQVEHPVTELVTGLDLVRLQLLVAEGAELPPEALSARMRGHAIEVRLYAEDPTNDWRPSVGRLHRFDFPAATPVRLDSGVENGSVVSPWYDPMLAKVIAYAPTRSEAARALSLALAGARIHGITTNRDLLVRILRHPEFLAGETDTGFLVRHDPAELGAPLASPEAELLHAGAAALAMQAERRTTAPVLGSLPSGWRNSRSQPEQERFVSNRGEVQVLYQFDRTGRSRHLTASFVSVETDAGVEAGVEGESDSASVSPEFVSARVDQVVLRQGGVDLPYDVDHAGREIYVDGPDGSSTFSAVERFPLPGMKLEPGSLVAPLPGTIVRIGVSVGDHVTSGQSLVAIEAMKMEHEIRAGGSGVVAEVAVKTGDQVESGRLLVVLKED